MQHAIHAPININEKPTWKLFEFYNPFKFPETIGTSGNFYTAM